MAGAQARADYLRGLVQGGELTPDERRDRSLATLIELVAELTGEVHALRDELAGIRNALASLAAGSRDDLPAASSGGRATVYCPGCGRAIQLRGELDAPGPVSIACAACGAVLDLD